MTDRGETAADRAVIEVTGPDALGFLQGLVTNDLRPLGQGPGMVWTAMLTPQGKYLFDFFVVNTGTRLLIDVQAARAAALLQRLTMYRLRAQVGLAMTGLGVRRGLGAAPPGTLPDPRHPALGWRAHDNAPADPPRIDWDAIRVAHLIPETGIELIPDDSYILECGFERLHGVDFRKGCYVGQEVTARMKHKTDLRKGLARLTLSGPVPPGTEILSGDRPAGRVHTVAGLRAIGYLRFDRADGPLTAGGVPLTADTATPAT
ncbi:MAG: folate-binding protein YgfZ [Rhodobacterales bacterium]|nr:folate-binding protein YgfZ [Rhodobacterales bacterium]